jgi:hypothetical protein
MFNVGAKRSYSKLEPKNKYKKEHCNPLGTLLVEDKLLGCLHEDVLGVLLDCSPTQGYASCGKIPWILILTWLMMTACQRRLASRMEALRQSRR